MTAYPKGLTSDVTLEDITNAVAGAVSAWSRENPVLNGCTDLELPLAVKLLSDTPPLAKYDHLNNVMFRDTWGCTPAPDGYPDCRDGNALAITSVFATKWGQIVDADVEVNTVNFTWADLDTMPPDGGRQDLRNALTHEFGHFIGLDHTCYADTSRARPNDQNGQPIPDCIDVSADDPIRATTMFASADPGDVSKRSLEPDDQHAVCAIYPAGGEDILACPVPDSGGGCAIASQPVTAEGPTRPGWRGWAAGTALLGLASVAMAGARRVRRRRRGR